MKFAVTAGVLEVAAGNKNTASSASATFFVDNTIRALVSSTPAHCAVVADEENPDLILTFSAAITALEASVTTLTNIDCFDDLPPGWR